MTKRKHIVRAPGTDRYLLEVPQSVTDLDDYERFLPEESARGEALYAPAPSCYGAGLGDLPITGFVATTADGITDTTDGFTVLTAGNYFIEWEILWGAVTPPMGGGCSEPPAGDRAALLLINGVADAPGADGGSYTRGTAVRALGTGATIGVALNAGAAGGGFVQCALKVFKL